MQSGFGGVSEIQQFMLDSSAHPFFSISSTSPPPQPPNSAAAGHEIFHPAAVAPANKLFNTYHRHPSHYSQQTPPPPPPHFPHFHSNIPITQQLFTPPPQPHHHHHHFQLFQTESESSVPHFLPADMKFKLAVEDSGGGSILHAENASESRLRSWHREDSCAIKEPFWRPLDLDYINSNSKRCKDKEQADLHFAKRSRVAEDDHQLENSHPGNNYKLFSELEAIYKPGGSNSTAPEPVHMNQTTGSGSALTGDEHPLITPVSATTAAAAAFDLDYHLEDDNSTGGEAHTNLKKVQRHSRRRRRRRRRQMNSIAAFFEGLLKQLMEHQEALHQKFLGAMEQRERERVEQEDARREQEAARARREALARAHDRELAAAREAAILSFLEKITGETIKLPSTSASTSHRHPNVSAEKRDLVAKGCDLIAASAIMPTSRWPKIEVQALIRVRSELDGQFQEPGLKGPLWEEVSAAMAAMGYPRSAKRCKEKWENINKYFRKSKESGRKRSQHSKTCPYFHQLDQLYSRESCRRIDNSELLDAVVVAGAGEEVGDSEGRRAAADEAEQAEDEAEEEAEDESSQFVEQLQ